MSIKEVDYEKECKDKLDYGLKVAAALYKHSERNLWTVIVLDALGVLMLSYAVIYNSAAWQLSFKGGEHLSATMIVFAMIMTAYNIIKMGRLWNVCSEITNISHFGYRSDFGMILMNHFRANILVSGAIFCTGFVSLVFSNAAEAGEVTGYGITIFTTMVLVALLDIYFNSPKFKPGF